MQLVFPRGGLWLRETARVGKPRRQSEQIIGGDVKKGADRDKILQRRFKSPAFDIRDLSLRHTGHLPQLGLAQIRVLAQRADPFTEGDSHAHHRDHYILESSRLLTYRHKTSILYSGNGVRKTEKGTKTLFFERFFFISFPKIAISFPESCFFIDRFDIMKLYNRVLKRNCSIRSRILIGKDPCGACCQTSET